MMNWFRTFQRKRAESGQALVEYALILALVVMAMAFALAATGPAIANIFSNVICTLTGQDPTTCQTRGRNPLDGGDPVSFWSTVTWVATARQLETPFPTPPLQPPTAIPTAGATVITNTPFPTDTPEPSPTIGPSPTPADAAQPFPFNDPANFPQYWRTDSNAVWLGSDDWEGRYYPNTTFSGTPTVVRNVAWYGGRDPRALEIDFNFGTGAPITVAGWTASDNFTVRWVRRIEIPTDVTQLRFTSAADDSASLYICNSLADARDRAGSCTNVAGILNNGSGTGTVSGLTPGSTRFLAYELRESTGSAAARLTIRNMGRLNPDDVVAAGNECGWAQVVSTTNANTRDNMYDENSTSDSFPAGQTCYYELRGWIPIDFAISPNPVLSFWEVWDLPAGTDVTVQVATYNSDRALMSWQDVMTRSGGTNVRNYEWTRSSVTLAGRGLGNQVAVRFRIRASSAGNPARWILDDIDVRQVTETTIGVDTRYNLNDTGQKSSFITSGRWDLTSTRSRGGTGWDDSPSYNTDRFNVTPAATRVHYIEFASLINLSAAPPADNEGDTGAAILSFWSAYDIAQGTRLEVQYTTNARDDGAVDTWTTIPATGGATALVGGMVADATAGNLTSLVMRKVEIPLDRVPGWNSANFRLRFALIVTGTTTRDGWWIDDIAIERFGGDKFTAYDFVDGAENDQFTGDNWAGVGNWATSYNGGVTERFLENQTTRAYSDSPSGNSIAGTTTTMEMSRYIDLMYDTPLNTNAATSPQIREATPNGANITNRRDANARPMLSFWMRRNLADGAVFAVDITTLSRADYNPNSDAEWTTIWTYTAPSSLPNNQSTRLQTSWERVEIDLRAALETAYTTTWATIANAGINNDDDIRIRFRLVSAGGNTDGISLDWIQIRNVLPAMQPVYRLWGATPAVGSVAAAQGLGAGNSTRYTDSIEVLDTPGWAFASLSPFERWYLHGAYSNPTPGASAAGWTIVTEATASDNGDGDIAWGGTGNTALHDSPGGNYENDSFVILEMQTIIDLRGVMATEKPALSYYQRYQTNSNDSLRLQISVSDPAATTQSYTRVAGWGAWTNVDPASYGTGQMGQNTTRRGWQRIQVPLETFVGRQIRVRWVVEATNSGGQGDGWYIDQVEFYHNLNGAGQATPFTTPWFDDAQSLVNWIVDGRWGTAPDWFRAQTDQESLGSSFWENYYFRTSEQIPGENNNYTGMIATMNRLWGIPPAGATTVPAISAAAPLGVTRTYDRVPFIYQLLDTAVAAEGPLDGTLGNDYRTNVGARWMRAVTLTPGTYFIQTSHDDEMRIWINNRTSTDVGSNNLIYEYASWMDRSQLRNEYFTVTSTIQRVIGVDFYQGAGPGHVFVNMGRLRTSFTNTPNTVTSGSYTVRNGPRPAITSIMPRGYFNTSAMTRPTLEFFWLANQSNSANFQVETSVDGGFTWTSALQTYDARMPATYNWQQGEVALPRAASVMFRFRFNTGNSGVDGIYITDLQVYDRP